MPLNFVWKVLYLYMYDLSASLKGTVQLACNTFANENDLNEGEVYEVRPVYAEDRIKLFRCKVGYKAKR